MASHEHIRITRKELIITGVSSLVIIALSAGFIYYRISSSRVFIDASSISAPQIELSPSKSGVLEDVYVQEGDYVNEHATVARVGNELIQAKVSGIVVLIAQKIGSQVSPGEDVVTMIDPAQLRVVGKIDEDKGLDRIEVGDTVVFTVDAFGSKKYAAVVDEVSPSSVQSGVVFNISDKREVKQFDIKARFDPDAYPELKNGMSARMWIYQR